MPCCPRGCSLLCLCCDPLPAVQNETEFITRLRVLAFYPWGGSARCSGVRIRNSSLLFVITASCAPECRLCYPCVSNRYLCHVCPYPSADPGRDRSAAILVVLLVPSDSLSVWTVPHSRWQETVSDHARPMSPDRELREAS